VSWAWSGDPAVVVASPPGAGKTRLVIHLAEQLNRRAALSIAISARNRRRRMGWGRVDSASESDVVALLVPSAVGAEDFILG
jgi:nucleoside-triphosphatase THEP1